MKEITKGLLMMWPSFYQKLRRFYHKYFGSPEPELDVLPFLVDNRRGAIDVGAHTGLYTDRLLELTTEVAAIEANPALVKRLESMFKGRVKVIFGAASDQAGSIELQIPEGRSGLATVAHDNFGAGTLVSQIDVRRLKLDELDLGPIGFIKIDVEGHELEVLRGAANVLQRDRPALLIEAEERHCRGAVRSLIEFLEPYGYSGFMLSDGIFKSVSSFSVCRDQRLEGSDPELLNRGIRPAKYINNFIFVA